MSVSRHLSAVVRPAFFGLASAVALASAPVLAQATPSAPPVVQAPGARGAIRGPLAGAPGLERAHGGRGMHGHRGRRGDASVSPEQRFEQRVQHMIGRLGLDAAQATQVRQIMTEGHAQHEALAGQQLTGEQRMVQHRAIMEANGQRIRALLRPDQQRVFDFHASRMREGADRMRQGGRRHGPMGGRGAAHLRGMIDALGLDDAQRTAVQRVLEEGRAQHEALRSQALTGDQAHARHRALMEANGQRIRALLRPDQQRLFDEQVAQLRQRFEQHRAETVDAAPGATQPVTPPSGI